MEAMLDPAAGGWGANHPVVELCQMYTAEPTTQTLGVAGAAGQLAASVVPAAAPRNTTCPDCAWTLDKELPMNPERHATAISASHFFMELSPLPLRWRCPQRSWRLVQLPVD